MLLWLARRQNFTIEVSYSLIRHSLRALDVVELVRGAGALCELARVHGGTIGCEQLVQREPRPRKLLLQLVLLERVQLVDVESLRLEAVLHHRLVLGERTLHLEFGLE